MRGERGLIVNIRSDLQALRHRDLLDLLLSDKTTKRHILWASAAYDAWGERYDQGAEILPELICGPGAVEIQTRAQKDAEQQTQRTRQHAEVFTPLWVCKQMLDHLDQVWFGRQETFFQGDQPTDRVEFPKRKRWQRYVDSRRLEITCGEAPFLVSRYDAATGARIPISRRVGILDRKLRVVTENTETEADWLTWAIRAVQATYGYEFQGDSLLIARVNVLMTFADYLQARWGRAPTLREYRKIANIVAWNLWQMDGLTGTIPYAVLEASRNQESFWDLWEAEEETEAEENVQPPCRIYNWRGKQSLDYLALKEKGTTGMKFDYIIGNPPYQEEMEGTSDSPVYNYFMDSAYDIAQKVELITPARFLFNAGKTPKAWNQKMLADPHLKVLFYEQNSSKVFSNTDIKGGVSVTYRDSSSDFGAIEVFSSFDEMRSMTSKVSKQINSSLNSIMFLQNRFILEALYADYPEYVKVISSDGRERRIVSSAFEKLSVFTNESPDDTAIRILGIVGSNKRGYRYVPIKYVEDNGNLTKWKVLLPKSNGSGAIGEVLSTPLIGEPLIGYTQSFIGIGAFDTEAEANAALKYIKSRFARTMLGVLKITQDNPPEKWKYVPLQDFTPASDIDWSQSIRDIDRQLYAKYGLSEEEITFIETHVKEMQ